MNFPFFASFIILILVLHYNIHRSNKSEKKSESSFWQHENEANNVRRQSLDTLNYITFSASSISPETLLDPTSCKAFLEETGISQIMERFKALEKVKMVNLNYQTNTELKVAYGVANLNILSEYDQHYTEWITLLQEYASLLAEKGHLLPALLVLETAIKGESDISASYTLAASIYKEQGNWEKIQELITQAEKLNSPRKTAIVRTLHKFDPNND